MASIYLKRNIVECSHIVTTFREFGTLSCSLEQFGPLSLTITRPAAGCPLRKTMKIIFRTRRTTINLDQSSVLALSFLSKVRVIVRVRVTSKSRRIRRRLRKRRSKRKPRSRSKRTSIRTSRRRRRRRSRSRKMRRSQSRSRSQIQSRSIRRSSRRISRRRRK